MLPLRPLCVGGCGAGGSQRAAQSFRAEQDVGCGDVGARAAVPAPMPLWLCLLPGAQLWGHAGTPELPSAPHPAAWHRPHGNGREAANPGGTALDNTRFHIRPRVGRRGGHTPGAGAARLPRPGTERWAGMGLGVRCQPGPASPLHPPLHSLRASRMPPAFRIPPESCSRLLPACPCRGCRLQLRAAPGPAVLVTCIRPSSRVQSPQLFVLLLLLPLSCSHGREVPSVLHALSSFSAWDSSPKVFVAGVGTFRETRACCQTVRPWGQRGRGRMGNKASPPLLCVLHLRGNPNPSGQVCDRSGDILLCCWEMTVEMDPRIGESFSLSLLRWSVLVLGQPAWPGCVPWPLWARAAPKHCPCWCWPCSSPECHLSWAGLASPGQETLPSHWKSEV